MAKGNSRAVKRKPQFGSDLIVDLMKAFDIEYTAFNPGATFRGIHDSIVNYGGNVKPQVIFCCHEEISVAIAHGYGKERFSFHLLISHHPMHLISLLYQDNVFRILRPIRCRVLQLFAGSGYAT